MEYLHPGQSDAPPRLTPVAPVLAYRRMHPRRRGPVLISAYVWGGLQLGPAGLVFAWGVTLLAGVLARAFGASYIYTSAGSVAVTFLLVLTGACGVTAAFGLLLWQWAPWKWVARAQAGWCAGQLLAMFSCCLWGAGFGVYAWFCLLVFTITVSFGVATLLYLRTDYVRAAYAWRTSHAWRDSVWARPGGPDDDEDDPAQA